MLAGKGVITAPGAFSPIIAQLAEKIGFKAVYFSGGAFSNLLGLPDLGVTSLTEVSEAVHRITYVTDLPLIVDADTGFGEAVSAARTVRELDAAGAAALHIEDQVLPKKCGHLDGKELVEADEMVKKLISAREASRRRLVVIARTDARAVEGLDSAVERARIYLNAGAEMIFPEALENEEEFAEFARKVDAPLLANMTEFGKTPYIAVSEFEKMGYKIVIFPATVFRATLSAAKEVLLGLKREGTQKKMLDRLMTRSEVYDIIDYFRYESADKVSLEAARRLMKGG